MKRIITAAEMEFLEVLIGKEEKERRRTDKRRDQGQKPMEQYNAERSGKINSNLEKLRKLKENNPKASQRKLAVMLGVSQSTIRNLVKKL